MSIVVFRKNLSLLLLARVNLMSHSKPLKPLRRPAAVEAQKAPEASPFCALVTTCFLRPSHNRGKAAKSERTPRAKELCGFILSTCADIANTSGRLYSRL